MMHITAGSSAGRGFGEKKQRRVNSPPEPETPQKSQAARALRSALRCRRLCCKMSAAKKLLAALLCAALLPASGDIVSGHAAPGAAPGRAGQSAGRVLAAEQKAESQPAAMEQIKQINEIGEIGLFGLRHGNPITESKIHLTDFGKTALLPSAFLAPGAATRPASASQTASAPAGAKRQKTALTAAERDRAERVVMASCGEVGNPLMAMANAQVIFDRAESGRFGNGVAAVLAAPGQFERPWKGPVNAMVRQAVAAVFDGGRRVTEVPIYYYINPYLSSVNPSVWEKDKRYVRTIGTGHLIHQYWTDK